MYAYQQATFITPQNIDQMIVSTSHNQQPRDKLQYITNDIKSFLSRNPACQCTIVGFKPNAHAQTQDNVFQVRGKLSLKLPQGQPKLLGFKFILPKMYPAEAPLTYLDEPENKEVVDMIDYLDQGNRIQFQWLMNWDKQKQNVFGCISVYNLMNLLSEVFKLFTKMPPVSFEELFGSAVLEDNNKKDEWEQLPENLLNPQSNNNLQIPKRERRNTQQQLKDLVKDDDDDMAKYDPQSELDGLQRQLSNNKGAEGNILQTRDTWKMNYKMKNQTLRKEEKEKLIVDVIIPKLKEQIADQVAQPLIEDTKILITKIDEYQEHQKELDNKLSEVTKQSKILKEALPQLDEQIALMKKELAVFDKLDAMTPENIQGEIFKPKDEITEEIVKQQRKCEAMQNAITGFMSVDEITDLKDWLKNIRKASSKQFKAQYKKNRLQQYLHEQSQGQHNNGFMNPMMMNGYPQ